MPKKINTTTVSKKQTRENWGKEYSSLPKLDLLKVQRESYQWFLDEGIGEVLEDISPIDDFTEKNWSLILKGYRLGKPKLDPATAISKGVTYDAPLYVN